MQFEVNVFGQVAVTRALLPALRARARADRAISSIGGRVAVPFNGPYAASKHAIEALGDALRGELAQLEHRRSALIEPGSVKTPIWDKAQRQADAVEIPPELQRRVRARAGGRSPASTTPSAAVSRPSRSRRRSSGRSPRAVRAPAISSGATPRRWLWPDALLP